MKPKLCFAIELPYIITEYEVLKPLALSVTNLGHSIFKWVFKVEDIKQVIKIIGKPISFAEESFEPLVPFAPALAEVVPDASERHGKGYFQVISRSPEIFVCETVRHKKPIRTQVPVENVKVLWEVMKKYQIHTPIKTSTVAKRVIERLGITRFNRLSDSFDWAKLLGERSEYFRYVYFPIKILQALGVVEHHKTGFVERLVDDWEMQTQIV